MIFLGCVDSASKIPSSLSISEVGETDRLPFLPPPFLPPFFFFGFSTDSTTSGGGSCFLTVKVKRRLASVSLATK